MHFELDGKALLHAHQPARSAGEESIALSLRDQSAENAFDVAGSAGLFGVRHRHDVGADLAPLQFGGVLHRGQADLPAVDDQRVAVDGDGLAIHHLRGAAGLAAGLDDAGEGVEAAHEAERSRRRAAARQGLTSLIVEVEGKTGLYFNQLEPKQPSKLALDDELADRLWAESARLVKLER